MSASDKNGMSAGWVSTLSLLLGEGGDCAELDSRGSGGRAAATQPQPTVAMWNEGP